MIRFLSPITSLLALFATILSGFLTFQFMEELSHGTGNDFTLPLLGVVLDLIKSVSPFAIIYLWNQNKRLAAVLFAVFALSLTGISFSASFNALGNGIMVAKKNSEQYQLIGSQIAEYQALISQKRKAIDRYNSIDRITDANRVSNDIPHIISKISSLRQQQQALDSHSFISKYGKLVNVLAAACLELSTWMLLTLSYRLNPTAIDRLIQQARFPSFAADHEESSLVNDSASTLEESPNTQPMPTQSLSSSSHSHKQTNTNDVETELALHSESVSEAMAGNAPTQSSSHMAAPHAELQLVVDGKEPIRSAISKAIINKQCIPSIRGVKEIFEEATREDIKDVQDRLLKAGLAEPYRRGIRLIA